VYIFLHIVNLRGTILLMSQRYNSQIRNDTRKLRSKGKTYSEIVRKLKLTIPKSTLSNWCSDVNLPLWYKTKIERLNSKNFSKAQKMAWASNKAKREKLLSNLVANNLCLVRKVNDKDVLKMLLAMLHLGEGAKWKSHRGLMLGSSDPDIIRLYIKLLNLCYGVEPKKLKCRVSYRADQNLKSLQRYWSQVTGVPVKSFYKTKPDPRTIGKPTLRKDYKGVCVVTCGGTDVQLELEAIPKIILEGL
jgi:hypothetical protein